MRKMKKLFMTFALLAVTISMMAACTNKSKTAQTEETAMAQTAETTAVEAADDLAPEIELPDLQGNPLKLSSLRGKYVVLDFWGSWCVWCIRGIPAMKEAYAKHKDKMEILGIDCRDTEKKWRDAVEKYELPWLHVRCNDEQLPILGQQYNLEGFPTKVVIDPEGKIAKVVVGEDPAFYTYLDELFK